MCITDSFITGTMMTEVICQLLPGITTGTTAAQTAQAQTLFTIKEGHMEENIKLSKEIQIILNTLPTLEMPPTFDNTNKMLGMYMKLYAVRDALAEKEEQADGYDSAE